MFSENTPSRESRSALLPSGKTAFFFLFFLLKKNEIPRKTRKHLGSVATRYRWRTANKMFVESTERVFAPRQLSLSLSLSSLSLSLFLYLFFSFLFLPREETLKHAPNWLMFKRARAFSWQQHLKLSIVFQSPCLGGDFGGRSRSIWKNQARQISGKSWRERNSLIIYIEREKGRRKIWKNVSSHAHRGEKHGRWENGWVR